MLVATCAQLLLETWSCLLRILIQSASILSCSVKSWNSLPMNVQSLSYVCVLIKSLNIYFFNIICHLLACNLCHSLLVSVVMTASIHIHVTCMLCCRFVCQSWQSWDFVRALSCLLDQMPNKQQMSCQLSLRHMHHPSMVLVTCSSVLNHLVLGLPSEISQSIMIRLLTERLESWTYFVVVKISFVYHLSSRYSNNLAIALPFLCVLRFMLFTTLLDVI